jgi:hypothetical protein
MRRSLLLVVGLTLVSVGCFRAFNVRNYPTSISLFEAGLERYDAEKYTDAANAFERLTLDLPSRDCPRYQCARGRSESRLGRSRVSRSKALAASVYFSAS